MKKYFSIVFVLCAMFMFSGVVSATIAPPPPTPEYPTEVDQCKKGGWMDYNGLFKNQGDCVSFVATDGRNQPDGPTAN